MPWVFRARKNQDRHKPLYAIVSKHGDGRLSAALLENLSIRTIAGSSSNGGKEAFEEMREKLGSGSHVAITPDGPTGPPEKAKLGAVRLASLTGAPIVPVALNSSNKWTFNSWDKLFIPKPFSKTLMFMGDKLSVKPNLSRAEMVSETHKLDRTLASLNQELNAALEG